MSLYEEEIANIEEKQDRLQQKQDIIDNKIDFGKKRAALAGYLNNVREQNEKIRKNENNIEDYKKKIAQCESNLEKIASLDEKNRKIQLYIKYAQALYIQATKIYDKNEKVLLEELNEIVKRNFKEMFSEQEKYAQLDENYNLRLYYKKINNLGDKVTMEADVLSEGEKIARNFAFIVSILELAKSKKELGDEISQSMPLVLDAPFSKLSEKNIAKVAKVLPQVSEQVILFMLDKDWEPSKLEQYTDSEYIYRTIKEVDANSSGIRRVYGKE